MRGVAKCLSLAPPHVVQATSPCQVAESMKELKYEEARAGGAGIRCMFHIMYLQKGRDGTLSSWIVQLHDVACTSLCCLYTLLRDLRNPYFTCLRGTSNWLVSHPCICHARRDPRSEDQTPIKASDALAMWGNYLFLHSPYDHEWVVWVMPSPNGRFIVIVITIIIIYYYYYYYYEYGYYCYYCWCYY